MKRLTITVDGRQLFDGEVAELQWVENDESVTATGRFTPSPNLLQALAASAQQRKAQVNQTDSVRRPHIVPNASAE